MKRAKLIATACFTAMLGVLTLNVAAQDFNTNERTYLTFSSTVELPGVTLQPGTYLFRLADSQSNRHIVQVFSQDEKQIFATILAVPAERQEVTGENVVTFRETAESATPAVQYWYYPGDRIGHEFVYPREQAVQIAKRTGQNVLSTDGEVTSAGSTVSSTAPDGQTTEWKREDTPTPATAESGAVQGTAGISEMPRENAEARQPQPQPETVAPAEETRNPETETPPAEPAATAQTDTRAQTGMTAQTERRDTMTEQGTDRTGQAVGTSGAANELPRTASPLPLAGLVGLLSLAGAAALRRARR